MAHLMQWDYLMKIQAPMKAILNLSKAQFIFMILLWAPFSYADLCNQLIDAAGSKETKVTAKLIAEDLKDKDLILFGEAHGDSNFTAMKALVQTQEFDCIFTEMPSDFKTDFRGQYMGQATEHPFFNLPSDNKNSRAAADFYKWLVTMAQEKSAKLFHSDMPVNLRNISPTNAVNYDNRNYSVANNISSAFQAKLCHKGIGFVGLAHLSTVYSEDGFQTQNKLRPIDKQHSLTSLKIATVSVANTAFDFIGEERSQCFKKIDAFAISGKKLVGEEKFWPLSSLNGLLKDFDFILIPNQ